jgi:uncharacterized membrane protein YfcA
MVKVYAASLLIGIIGLVIILVAGAFAQKVRRPERDPGERIGPGGKTAVGALIGFGMGGISAEFSPLDLSWPVCLAIALVAALLSLFWVRYAARQSEA